MTEKPLVPTVCWPLLAARGIKLKLEIVLLLSSQIVVMIPLFNVDICSHASYIWSVCIVDLESRTFFYQ